MMVFRRFEQMFPTRSTIAQLGWDGVIQETTKAV